MQPDLVGYGENIYAGFARNRNKRSLYVTKSGTSMATPYVTGIAALYASENPALRGARLHNHLLKTALKLDANGDQVGAGLARYVESESK
jgi:subtilisin family serine protease